MSRSSNAVNMVIEQYLPAFHYGDAVGNSVLALHRALLAGRHDSRIVALDRDECLADQAQLFSEYRPEPKAVKILHYAIPSPLSAFFRQSSGKKVLIYHNVTPPHFFMDFAPPLVGFLQAAREELSSLRDSFDLVLADSSFNGRELTELGFGEVKTFPLSIDLSAYETEYSQSYRELFADERKTILFVGRVSPNKKIEDLVKLLFFYKKYLSPSIRLIVAGNTRTLPRYFHAVRDLAARFLLGPEDIHFTGHIPFAELLSLYRLADVFISLSEHEGFCLPLIESCFFSLPVIAYDAGAVAETLDGAGLLVREKAPDRLAALAELIINDQESRRLLQRKGRERLAEYRNQADPRILVGLLQNL